MAKRNQSTKIESENEAVKLPAETESLAKSAFGPKPDFDIDTLPASAQERLKADPEARFGPKGIATDPSVFKNLSGNLSGVASGDKTFFGMSPEDVGNFARGKLQKQELPADVLTLQGLARSEEQAKQAEIMKQQGALLAGGVGELNPNIVNAPQGASPIDVGQVIGAGASRLIPGVVGSLAAGGAAALTGVGAPLAPFITAGGIITSIATAISGAQSNLASQRSGQISASSGGLSDGTRNLKIYVTSANKNPAGAAEYYEAFNEQLSYIERDRNQLILDTKGFLKDLTGKGGTPQLADFNRFYANGGQRDYLIYQMKLALANPDPNKNLIDPYTLE